MILDELHTKKESIEHLAMQYGVHRVRVFGSVARKEETPDSDIDFLVDLPRGYDLFGQRLPFARELAELLGRNVDVIPKHELNKHMRAAVLKESVDL